MGGDDYAAPDDPAEADPATEVTEPRPAMAATSADGLALPPQDGV